ncbi:MAG: hypothetical protein LKH27_02825 [Prevotella sp.]|nr:hypothetical protein [Prevotella sp.]MCI1473323.1 hypothetical protein [Prevotella sp.]MCI1548954.1 hypothetical protein [Prevotella sp.]
MEYNGNDIVLLSGRSRESHPCHGRWLFIHPAGLGNVKALLSKTVSGSRECKSQNVDFGFHSP